MAPDPAWLALDQIYPSFVADYSIDRGRSFELDRVDVGRATVTINDLEGRLDPTNPLSPFWNEAEDHTQVQPLKQARLALWNPVAEDWFTRFRGFVEGYEYEFDPSQKVNRVTISLVDIFEIVSAVEMYPGYFGDPIPPENVAELGGNVFFEDTANGDVHGMQRRVVDVLNGSVPPMLGTCGIPPAFYVVFSGNVSLHEGVYSAGQSAMDAIQEAVDAEFPGVSNVYCDRLGRLCVHGRYARFDPEGTAAVTPGWDFHSWKAGDGAAVNASPTDTAHIRAFSTSRDLTKIVNVATASPKTILTGTPLDEHMAAQVIVHDTSKGHYGIRPWSTENLLTKEGVTDGDVLATDGDAAWTQTKRFARYYVDNYHAPQNRVTTISFRSKQLGTTGAAANWDFLTSCDIGDRVLVTIGAPGGGGLDAVPFFIEGVHEQVQPLSDALDDVTLTLDLSPASYFDANPFADPP